MPVLTQSPLGLFVYVGDELIVEFSKQDQGGSAQTLTNSDTEYTNRNDGPQESDGLFFFGT